FLLAIVLLAGVFMSLGRPYTPAVIGGVEAESPAAVAELRVGDRVLSVNGDDIASFEELALYVRLRPNQPLAFEIERGGRAIDRIVTPAAVTLGADTGGAGETMGRIGVQSADVAVRDTVGPVAAVGAATAETVRIIDATLTAIGQMFVGDRSVRELGGPLRIAEVSADAAESGLVAFIMLAVVLSINLGLLNLFPIPVLDGGHLVFYAFEAVRGRPLGERAQEIGFRVGLALVIALMVFATWNDAQRFIGAGLGVGGAS
ncbi:MAG: RIP metalloprotease RseP, partial [Pseudomonadota bacterium]